MIFDTHIHLNDKIYQAELELLIADALSNGVKYFLVVGYNFETSKKAIEIAEKYPFIYAAIGIHPSEVSEVSVSELDKIEQLAKSKKVVAIGEIGFDYFHCDNKEEQEKYFIEQIKIANKLNLPVVIHSRDAIEDTFNILNEYRVNKTGIIHCYSSSIEMAERFIKLDYYIAIGGAVTFKNAVNLKNVAAKLPLDRLLVETDAPWLTPHPNRGKVNLPKYITYTVAEIAHLKNISFDEVVCSTTMNAFKILGLKNE